VEFTDAEVASGQKVPTGRGVTQDAFLLTWKETGWPYKNIMRMLASFARNGYVEEEWRIASHRRAKAGDRGWLLKQGHGPRGIFAAGTILKSPQRMITRDGKERWMALVRFEHFSDPRGNHLINEKNVRAVLPDSKIRDQASGGSLTREEADALENLLIGNSLSTAIDASAADEWAFEPTNTQDARGKIASTIFQRRGQKAFRDTLLDAYDGRCAISGCPVLHVLEAAHIHPYRGPNTNHVQNGLLLRADLHTLFDCGLINIEPTTMRVVVDEKLKGPEYELWHGKLLRQPGKRTQKPSDEALRMRKRAS